MDNWSGMEFDSESIARIKKSCELLDCKIGMTVLDIGCYRQVARQFLPLCEYHGFDCERYVDNTIVRDLETGFLWHGKVDRILCLEVLEHLKTPSMVLRSIKDSLKEDGVAVISLPNEATLFHRLRSFFGTVDAECFGERGKHLHLPNLQQCRNLLKQRFEIVDEQYYVSSQGTRQKWLSQIMKTKILYSIVCHLARFCPSLFARGFIFKLKKK